MNKEYKDFDQAREDHGYYSNYLSKNEVQDFSSIDEVITVNKETIYVEKDN